MIEHIKNPIRIANDINPYVIALFKELLNGFEMYLFDKAHYQYVKDNLETQPKHISAFVGFCGSYGAKWFNGFANVYINNRHGNNIHRNYIKDRLKNLETQIKNLKDVQFYNKNYYELEIPNNSFIYCDPPYENTTAYKGTDKFNHNKFWEWCRDKSKNSIVLISEYNAPSDFECIWQKEHNTTISRSCKTAIEKLFVHKSQSNLFTDNNLF